MKNKYDTKNTKRVMKWAAFAGLYTASVIGGGFLTGCAQSTVSAVETASQSKPSVLARARYPYMPQ